MPTQRIAISAVFAPLLAIGLAALPLSAAKAQYYGPPCTPFPLTWPFCVAGAVVGTAATIVSVPFRAAAGPYYGYGYYPPPYYPPRYYGQPYYYGR
jgi:hypothetical protein